MLKIYNFDYNIQTHFIENHLLKTVFKKLGKKIRQCIKSLTNTASYLLCQYLPN